MVVVAEADYKAGTWYALQTNVYFVGSPVRDYTVQVYSKQNLTVTDDKLKGNVLHLDGQLPTGFTDQKYWGMDIELVGTTLPEPVKPPAPTGPSVDEIMNGQPSNSDELFKNFDILWEDNPIKAIGYFMENWGAIFIFW